MSQLSTLRDAIRTLEARLRTEAGAHEASIEAVHPDHRQSARNFVHYMALRQTDLRSLQSGLFRYGLSSLGRIEGHVLDGVTKVRDRLDDVIARVDARGDEPPSAPPDHVPTWDDAERLLHAHTRALLGPRPQHRHVSVMVTAPSAAEVTDAWVERLLSAGMNVLRVNAAHEDEAAWLHIVETARAVAKAKAAHLSIAVDLPGPKLRTVMLEEGPRVAKWRPERDAFGRVVKPCVVTLFPASAAVSSPATHAVALPEDLFRALEVGDELTFRDTRESRRVLEVVKQEGDGWRAELRDTAYVVPGTRFVFEREGGVVGELAMGPIPPRPFRLELAMGQSFFLMKPGATPPPGLPALGCTLDEALSSLRVGQRVLFDDGHLEAIAEEIAADHVRLRVTYAAGGTFRLGAEKGINLPDTELALPLLSPDDERALAFACAHADIVDASFVRGPEDVRELYRRLAELGADRLGVVLKIETQGAFGRLPAILMAALERAPVGVMIARGDLAIESGYERLAELQEEMLWLCEAAHVPVIWATQVLDTLARTGRPSRAEVTDAAMSVRAECVMLNKGPYVAEAVTALDDILRRMEQHTYKKRSLYRRLHLELPR
jgi:pyruvate kinase